MKQHLFPLLILLSCQLIAPSCQQQQQQQADQPAPQKEEAPPPLYLGTIHQVFPADNFALVRIIGPRPAEGTVLVTHPQNGSADRVGNLLVSSAIHARNSIIAADIRAGVVMKGDRVYQYRSIAAAPVEEETEEETTPEAFTLHGEEVDLGYMPPEVRARRERNAKLAEAAESAAQLPQQTPQTQPVATATTIETPEDDNQPSMPEITTPVGMPGIDSVPDDISGWDSM